jgi:hypothetical protein
MWASSLGDMNRPMETKWAQEHGYIEKETNLEGIFYNDRSKMYLKNYISLDFLEISASKWINRDTLELQGLFIWIAHNAIW